MPVPAALPSSDSDLFTPALLVDVLAVSLTAIHLLRPLYDGGELVDFTVEYLNPAAQRMTGLGERPGGTMQSRFPDTVANGVFAMYRRAFESGAAGQLDFDYQADGFNNYLHVAARRSGERLVVSFTDTAAQPRGPVEDALRRAQAAERAARADAEEQRAALGRAFEQAPVPIAILRGPEFVVELANPSLGALWGRPVAPALGRPLFEALPDMGGQGLEELLATALRTGQPVAFQERPTVLDRGQAGLPALGYYNFTYQPLHDAQGLVTGLITVGIEVTEQVLARQQMEQVNQELEARVQERTEAALVAQAEVLATAQRRAREREAFFQVFEQTPALVALLRSPGHRFEYANPAYQRLFPGRSLVGREMAEAVPELQEQGFVALLDRVYQTGEMFFGAEMPFALAPADGEPTCPRYFNFTYQAYREGGEVAGISVFAYDVTEQVLARQEREAERQRLHALFMQAPAGICILAGPELVFEFVNPGYQQLLPGRRLHGRPIFEALPEMAGTAVEALLRGVYATGRTHEEQGLLVPVARPADGELENRYFTFVYQARRNEQRAVDGVLVFAFEVTEQVVARQKVEESREELKRFKFMADQARDAFILMREDGSFAYLNHRALEAWGYSAEETAALRVPDVDPLHDQAAYTQLFGAIQQGAIGQFETLHRRKDGHVFPVEVSLAGLQLGGEPHLLAVARDITEQQRTLAALRESEARFRVMADAAPNHVWAVHPDATVRYVNRAFLDFVGMRLDEYVEEGWAAFMHPDELAGAQQALEEAIRTRTIYSLEHRMRRHDGEYRWLLAQGAPSFYASGEMYGYVGSAIDITELKQANEQLRRTNVDLDNFIYTASHDLKAPIINIEGLLVVLREHLAAAGGSPDVLMGQMLDMMQGAIERFQLTIAQLTDIARLQQAHDQPAEEVGLAAVVEAVCLDLAPLLVQAAVHLTVDVVPDLRVRWAPKDLRSIVYNLLSNAVKYRDSGRRCAVQLRAAHENGGVTLEVQDNGLGLTEQQQSQLFGIFRRLHTHVDGTGVGLYMVKRMVENGGGTITLQSQAGVGTTFRVTFPAQARSAGPAQS